MAGPKRVHLPPLPAEIHGWTVLEEIALPRNGRGRRRIVRVRCSQGHETTRDVYGVLKGSAGACVACTQHVHVEAGDKHNQLTAIELIRGRRNHFRVRFRCDCGTEKVYWPADVVNGRIKSCGCARRRVGPDSYKWQGLGELSANMVTRFRVGAAKRNIAFEVTIEELWRLFLAQRGRCALSGVPLFFGPKMSGNASLDRKDSSKPYTPDNVQWTTKDANLAKQDLSDAEFIALCETVADHQRALRAARDHPPAPDENGQCRLWSLPTPAPGSEPSTSPRVRRR